MMDIFQYINKENLTNLKMMLQIHDELIFEVLDKDSQTVSKFIKKIMSDVSSNEFYNFSVPLTVDINVGKNWEEAH
jgi:DNA polymerase-1